ncbi:MAG: alpha/beta hydrolase [Deltaproteobacteria bacterium]|nr:alpha/beta hydrolase [Deltaproteobacteria bacterium]
MPQLYRPGVELNYEVWGDQGQWVTLINGHNRSLTDFKLCGRYLVERGWRVLAVDNRGAGLTKTSAAFTIADMVADIGAVWEAEAISRTRVLGISMGGFLAQILAVERAARVAALVLVSTAMNQAHIQRDEAPWTADPELCEAKLKPYFTADFAKRNELLIRSMAKQIAKSVADGDFAARSNAQRQAMAGLDLVNLAPRIKAPTLVIHGEDDQVIPVAAAYELASAIKGAKLELIPDTGHLLLAERPKELYGLIAQFFASTSGGYS